MNGYDSTDTLRFSFTDTQWSTWSSATSHTSGSSELHYTTTAKARPRLDGLHLSERRGHVGVDLRLQRQRESSWACVVVVVMVVGGVLSGAWGHKVVKEILYFEQKGANGVAMPTDEDDQNGHFFYNHPERGAYSAA